MKKKEITIGNDLIAKWLFPDIQKEIDAKNVKVESLLWVKACLITHTPENLDFHTNWNTLIPVVEKIESMYNGIAFSVVIENCLCKINQNTQHWMAFKDTIDLPEIWFREETKIESVWLAVIEFIKFDKSINK